MIIRELLPKDADSILDIYKQGVESGQTTFATAVPDYEEWDAAHHNVCRYVAVCDDVVVGFVALSPVSSKPHYSGVAEVMVYVDEHYHHQGIGTQLLNTLIKAAPQHGVWCLYASIFASNESSIRLHAKCGFRTIGYRERIAKDRFGNWTDTVMMEYRFADDIIKE